MSKIMRMKKSIATVCVLLLVSMLSALVSIAQASSNEPFNPNTEVIQTSNSGIVNVAFITGDWPSRNGLSSDRVNFLQNHTNSLVLEQYSPTQIDRINSEGLLLRACNIFSWGRMDCRSVQIQFDRETGAMSLPLFAPNPPINYFIIENPDRLIVGFEDDLSAPWMFSAEGPAGPGYYNTSSLEAFGITLQLTEEQALAALTDTQTRNDLFQLILETLDTPRLDIQFPILITEGDALGDLEDRLTPAEIGDIVIGKLDENETESIIAQYNPTRSDSIRDILLNILEKGELIQTLDSYVGSGDEYEFEHALMPILGEGGMLDMVNDHVEEWEVEGLLAASDSIPYSRLVAFADQIPLTSDFTDRIIPLIGNSSVQTQITLNTTVGSDYNFSGFGIVDLPQHELALIVSEHTNYDQALNLLIQSDNGGNDLSAVKDVFQQVTLDDIFDRSDVLASLSENQLKTLVADYTTSGERLNVVNNRLSEDDVDKVLLGILDDEELFAKMSDVLNDGEAQQRLLDLLQTDSEILETMIASTTTVEEIEQVMGNAFDEDELLDAFTTTFPQYVHVEVPLSVEQSQNDARSVTELIALLIVIAVLALCVSTVCLKRTRLPLAGYLFLVGSLIVLMSPSTTTAQEQDPWTPPNVYEQQQFATQLAYQHPTMVVWPDEYARYVNHIYIEDAIQHLNDNKCYTGVPSLLGVEYRCDTDSGVIGIDGPIGSIQESPITDVLFELKHEGVWRNALYTVPAMAPGMIKSVAGRVISNYVVPVLTGAASTGGAILTTALVVTLGSTCSGPCAPANGGLHMYAQVVTAEELQEWFRQLTTNPNPPEPDPEKRPIWEALRRFIEEFGPVLSQYDDSQPVDLALGIFGEGGELLFPFRDAMRIENQRPTEVYLDFDEDSLYEGVTSFERSIWRGNFPVFMRNYFMYSMTTNARVRFNLHTMVPGRTPDNSLTVFELDHIYRNPLYRSITDFYVFDDATASYVKLINPALQVETLLGD